MKFRPTAELEEIQREIDELQSRLDTAQSSYQVICSYEALSQLGLNVGDSVWTVKRTVRRSGGTWDRNRRVISDTTRAIEWRVTGARVSHGKCVLEARHVKKDGSLGSRELHEYDEWLREKPKLEDADA